MKKSLQPLTPKETHIIVNKGTERPFSGHYVDCFDDGIYLCKQCHAPLYRSEHKFHTHCGWPSFDNEISDAIKRQPDADGHRVEIVCAACDGHLGHLFEGEQLTPSNQRHCVNSISMVLAASAYFAGGCFWGVEHLMQQQAGVIHVIAGFMGGQVNNPSYAQVCQGKTGHVETVEVLYDQSLVTFEELAKLFFEIHDPTQNNGQGADLGSQYQSVLFYSNDSEKHVGEKLILQLQQMGLNVATQLTAASTFWKADSFHQDYYQKNGGEPYCHRHIKRFDSE